MFKKEKELTYVSSTIDYTRIQIFIRVFHIRHATRS